MNIASRLCPEVFISANPFSHFEQSTPVPFPQRTGLLEIMTGLVYSTQIIGYNAPPEKKERFDPPERPVIFQRRIRLYQFIRDTEGLVEVREGPLGLTKFFVREAS